MVHFDVHANDQPTLAKNFEEDTYDQWDKQSIEYHDQYSKNNSNSYAYGSSDLGYYGGYSKLAGYGTFWQPHSAGAGGNSVLAGAWSRDSGFGYIWGSAYSLGGRP